jgi:hypothetical protein
MPVDGGVNKLESTGGQLQQLTENAHQTTAGKADRPALKEDSLAEKNTGTPNSKL